jgi:hypothetical protein
MKESTDSPRKYSLAEIDKMRSALNIILIRPNSCYDSAVAKETIERRLRTYLLAGIDPEELFEKARRTDRARQ